MHGFCDALEKAFAAVVYLRSAYEDGTVEVKLVASKTCVSPLKSHPTIIGAIISSRLMSNVTGCLFESLPKFYWTDSMAIPHWIQVTKPWKQ